jgi:Phage endonuclease I
MGFKSGFERTIDANLRSRRVMFTYETMELPYTLHGVYHPDFILGNGVIVEAKGKLDRESKRKMVAVKKAYPHLDIRFLFMEAGKKVPGTKQTHAQWADRNGFPWAEGEIPKEWTV